MRCGVCRNAELGAAPLDLVSGLDHRVVPALNPQAALQAGVAVGSTHARFWLLIFSALLPPGEDITHLMLLPSDLFGFRAWIAPPGSG